MSKRGRTDSLILCNLSTTYLVNKEPFGPEIRIYGRTQDGQAIVAICRSFYPYFFAESDVASVNELLNAKLDQAISNERDKPPTFVPYISSTESVLKTPVMGYQPDGKREMVKITMNSPKFIAPAKNILEHNGIPTHEAKILYVLRFLVDTGIGGFDWVEISQFDQFGNNCIEFHQDNIKLVNYPDEVALLLSFDIEACKNGRGFVTPEYDPVSQISCDLFVEKGLETIDKRVFSLVPKGKGVSPLPEGIIVEAFEEEENVLLGWAKYINDRNPDILTGYNIDGFDYPYLFERAKVLGISEEFCRLLSRDPSRPATIRKSKFASRGKGARIDYKVTMEGRISIDCIKIIKDSMKLRSYGLAAVSETLLERTKVEMPYENIPIYQAGTDEQRAHLCYYCFVDAQLVREILKVKYAIITYAAYARISGVPLDYLLDKGQQILTTSLMLRFGRIRHYVIPSSTESQNDEETEGATVLDPEVGFYQEDTVITLDFQSLYPSIIRDRNICYTTKVSLAWAKKHLAPKDYWIPPLKDANFCFVAEHILLGILNEMETTLFNKRQEAKAKMKNEKDPARKEAYNQEQTAIKLRMNSIYGYLKANTICDKDLMESVTGEGRRMIRACKELVEREFPGSKVVYGDSVTADTPILLFDQQKNQVIIKSIEFLSDSWELRGDGKEIGQNNRYLCWTEAGWTKIIQVIRHKTDKPIKRVRTGSGIVDCTTDHGLVRDSGERVAVGELKIGEKLLHKRLTATRIAWDICENSTKVVEAYRELLLSINSSPPDITIKEISDVTHLYLGQYVYDLETENHHFQAGIGCLIVHNTDSIFITFGKSVGFHEAFAKGQQAAEMCTELMKNGRLKGIHVLQREKGFKNFLLQGKKRYAGLKFLTPDATPELSSSGMETVRRDNARIGSETLQFCLENIIVHGDAKGERSIKYVHEKVADLLQGKIDFSQLIVSKGLSKTWEQYAKSGALLPHVELSHKIDARMHKTGERSYVTGDRVKFVFIKGPKGSKNAENAEDPLYALKNRLPIDFTYYVENQMMKPLLRLFTPILAPQERLKKVNSSGKKVALTDKELKTLTAYKVLFEGPHMHTIVQKIPGNGGLLNFGFKPMPRCLSCGAQMGKIAGAVCDSCESEEILGKLTEDMKKLELKKEQAYDKCVKCSPDSYQICCNNDCENYFVREKVVIDIEDLGKKLSRFK